MQTVIKIKSMANITKESEEIKKTKNKTYDGMFFSLIDSINKKEKLVDFDKKEKTLYIKDKIVSNDKNFLTLCENYTFFINGSLF
jgi:hypothetical protein